VCEWPAAKIPLSRHEIDAQAILDAATRASVIFSEENLPEGPGGTSHACGPPAFFRGTLD
jgi:hypothetical protein